MNENHAQLSPALVETIAGLTAGTFSTLAVHPLDVIKTRLQISRNTSTTPITSLAVLRTLTSNAHPIRSVYRGLTPNLLGNASSWAIFFYFKSIIETQLRAFHNQSSSHNAVQQHLSPVDYFLASGFSGLLITLATNPIWVLKTRMLSSDAGTAGAYPSMWAGARDVWVKDGLKGFYRGLGVSCLGVSHGAVQFGVYEPLKRSWKSWEARRLSFNETQEATDIHNRRDNEKLGNEATLLLSAAAKIVAGTVTYPYQVVRSRIQTYDSEARFGRGVTGVVGKVWKEEGIKGFYRGLGPNVVRVMPATWVTFLVYENVRFYLPQWGVERSVV